MGRHIHQVKEDGLKITLQSDIDFANESPAGSQLLKEALVTLIERMGPVSWGGETDEISPDEFYAAILAAVARSYEPPKFGELDERKASEVLLDLIADLRNKRYL